MLDVYFDSHLPSLLQDSPIDTFLRLVHCAEEQKVLSRAGEVNFEPELTKSIQELTQAKAGPLIKFMPLILDKLLQLMVRPPVLGGQVGKLCICDKK